MNISELARKMRVNPKDMPGVFQEIGVDLGARAIKIDDATASKVLRAWPQIRRERENKLRAAQAEAERQEAVSKAPQLITLPSVLTVRDFAEALRLPVTTIIRELMNSGILASMNERIDYDTAAIVAEDLGYTIARAPEKKATEADAQDKKAGEMLRAVQGDLRPRPPVIVVMGHVDHGKTKLLDAIRTTNVMGGEAGGITQHIGAYQVEKKGRMLTFIDTPGHEAFTTMRSRGARVADFAILVVALDDGVQPQTLEALHIIQGAELPYIIALNKADKPEANIDRVKQQLAEQKVLLEGWGGSTPAIPLSAKTGQGIDELLEMIVLFSDLHKETLTAVYDTDALGTIIESHVDTGEGPVATMLIQAGVLKPNAVLAVDNLFYGKARALRDFQGNIIRLGTPGMPVKIVGLKLAPAVGDVVRVVQDMKALDRKTRTREIEKTQLATSITRPRSGDEEKGVKVLNLIIRADVAGSLEAIILALEQRSHPQAKVRIVQKGLGAITESDVTFAQTTDAAIVGFSVEPTEAAAEMAREKHIAMKTYKIIYDLLKDIETTLTALLAPRVEHVDVGKVQVLKIFKQEKKGVVLGGKILEGNMRPKYQMTIQRQGETIGSGEIVELRAGQQVVREIAAGEEGGMRIKTDVDIHEHDVLLVYKEESHARTLADR